MVEARDAAVAGVLGAALLGSASLGAVASGASMGAALAGVLLTWFAAWAARESGALVRPRAVALLGVAWLAAVLAAREAALGMGLAVNVFGGGAPSRGVASLAAVLSGLLYAAAIAGRLGRVAGLKTLGMGLAATAAVLGVAAALLSSPSALVLEALVAGLAAFAEMVWWRGLGLAAG